MMFKDLLKMNGTPSMTKEDVKDKNVVLKLIEDKNSGNKGGTVIVFVQCISQPCNPSVLEVLS